MFAATLVRSADGGAVVAIVLLARDAGLPSWVAGLLGAAITAPHLLGPFIARRLDTAEDALIVGTAWLPVAVVAGARIVIALLTALDRTRHLNR